MDDVVKQAMAKWPNVPAVYGWLGLDRRGAWLIKGERISNPLLAACISRNYEHDAAGRWFFQNGPQRVFVALDYTPFVYRIGGNSVPGAPPTIEAHTGRTVARVDGAWIDDSGILLIATEHGPGMIDDRDLELLLPSFTDERGQPLSEEAIAGAIERLQAGAGANLYFSLPREYGARVKPSHGNVPARFGFGAAAVQPRRTGRVLLS